MIMNRNHFYTAVMALATGLPVLADINVPVPRVPANTAAMQGNCDLLASNTVRATFRGLRDMPVQTLDQDSPTTAQVAVFEVIENLAYRKYVRYGDGQLLPGTRFTVAMNRELPGQPAKVVDTIAQMQPGEESVMRIDHLYLMGGQEGTPIRACSRMASRKAVSAQQEPSAGEVPTTAAPLTGSGNGSTHNSYRRESVSMHVDANGNVQTVRTISEYDPASGKVVTRMFINDQEVDPQTRQPLAPKPAAAPQPTSAAAPTSAASPVSAAAPAAAAKPVQPAPAPQPVPAAQPAAPAPQPAADGDAHDDTVIEGEAPQPVQPAAPAPQPAAPAAAPAAPPAPAPAPVSEEDGF